MIQKTRFSIFAATSMAVGLLASAGFFAPALAQDIVPHENRGVPQDWSHRHVVFPRADTMKEASAKGTVEFERWKRKMRDPRFVMSVARRTVEVQPTVNKMYSGQQLAFFDRFARKPKNASLKRDWSVALGDATAVDGSGTGTGVGTEGMFPAKYTWDLNATPSCANDFIVYSTMTPGATNGTSARQTVSFGGTGNPSNWTTLNAGAGTLTINNPGVGSITLVARNTASDTNNAGLNFYLGNSSTSSSRAYYAYNLAAAINRNGVNAGVSATSLGGVVTIVATQAGSAGNNITLSMNAALSGFDDANGNPIVTLGGANLAGGAAGGVQPTLVAYNQLYKTTCTTGTGAVAAGSPNIFWSYNTGSGATVETSPALSLDGTQVAFVQRTSASTTTSSTSLNQGQTAHLVLLKWKAGTAGSHATTVAPTEVANGDYRGCTAPCMTKFALGANNQNSSPYVDYTNDVIFVGDAYGRLHKFTNVFNGTPSAAAGWPVTVSSGNMLSSPVFDSASNQVFVGTDVSEVGVTPASGGVVARVDASNGTVVSSGQIAGYLENTGNIQQKLMGVRDGLIVDSQAQRAYAFLESDITTTCGGATNCKAVNQFATNFAAGNTGTARQLGRGQIGGRALYIGQFDDAYWNSNPTSPTGYLYACGSVDGGNSRAPTVWRIPITNNTMGTAVSLVTLTSAPAVGEVGATCSPTTIVKNGANEYLFNGVTANGTATGCTGACIYMMQLQGASPNSDVTSTPAVAVDTNDRFISVSTAAAVNTTEASVETTRTSAALFTGMTITQSQPNPSGGFFGANNRTIQYWLRRNGADTGITCTVAAGAATCNAPGSVLYAPGDKISVRLNRSNNDNSVAMTFRVQLTGSGSSTTQAFAGLSAPGGTSGIVVDNVSSQAGASQVYFSTLQRPGRAFQASQAGLQ